jgi:hypothetical protein
VRDTCARFGTTFDAWQVGAGRLILGKAADGMYAADETVVSIPRQVGKTYLFGWIMFALCIIRPGTLALWTAHRFPTACDVFDELKGIVENNPKLDAHVKRITTAADNKVIEFRNGSKIHFGARERGFGRGFKRVSILMFDEAQILTENALDDMIPATNTIEDALVFYAGTPPKPSNPSEAFTRFRHDAIAGDSESTIYIEFSADEGADPLDREQWAKANPSYPRRTSARAILRMRKNLTPDSFMREALGIWDSVLIGVFTAGKWAKLAVDVHKHPAPAPAALGVAADIDGVWLQLGAASVGERPHLGSSLRLRADGGKSEFVSEVKRIANEQGVDVAIDKNGPAAFLIPELEQAGVPLVLMSFDEAVHAGAELRDAVETGRVEHGDYDDLNEAVDAATWQMRGDRRVLGRKNGDISALESVSLALWRANGGGVDRILEPSVYFL